MGNQPPTAAVSSQLKNLALYPGFCPPWGRKNMRGEKGGGMTTQQTISWYYLQFLDILAEYGRAETTRTTGGGAINILCCVYYYVKKLFFLVRVIDYYSFLPPCLSLQACTCAVSVINSVIYHHRTTNDTHTGGILLLLLLLSRKEEDGSDTTTQQ